MTKWALVTMAVIIIAGTGAVAAARFFGTSHSRLSVMVSVISYWLGAYVLWSFAAGLAAKYHVIDGYEAGWFALFAVAAGSWHYRVRIASGPERALVVFVGAQLVWLLVLLYRNGVITP